MRYQGCGKRYAKEWKEEMEKKGFEVREYSTTDNEWGNRPIRYRRQPGFVDALRVWGAGNGWQGLWYYAIDPHAVDPKVEKSGK